jgi:hypothetical protein
VVLNSEDGYETYELPSVSLPTPNVVIGVSMSGPVQTFWFTDEGRDETSDKTFTAVGNPLFDEDGSVARNELYDSAVPLSFMQHDGNMFDADSDSDIVRYLPMTDRLVLSIPGDSTTRDKSAWSVQVAKLFVLSYANTQLPDVQIELPINEVGEYGMQITLPTIDGEYESGGKTWKPSAWDIGAFGSSYSLTADVVAHLVFTEVVQYTEITLYMASGNKQAQKQVTSGFTGNVNATYCYQLYVDDQLTTPWAEYDYSNDYELGNYSDGVWIPWTRTSVSSLPDTYTSDSTQWRMAFILMDNGFLWIASNVDGSGYIAFPSGFIIVRIYPKGQQQYSLYFSQNTKTYDNYSTSGGMVYKMKHRPGDLSYSWMPWSASFPKRTIVNALYSSGKTGVSISDLSFNGTKDVSIKTASGYAPSFRNVIFTLDAPTYTSWANLSGNKSAESNEVCPLFDRNGEYVVYDPMMNYTIIGLFNYSGGHPFNSPNRFMLDAQLGAFDTGNPTRLCFKLNRAVTFSYVWYIKTPSATVSKAGNFGQYNWTYPPDENTVLQPGESCVLDDSGTPGTTYAYDSTKSYGVLQWQTESGTRAGATELQIVRIEQGGQTIIGCKNVSSASVTVSYVRVCVCSSSSATVVSVYDSSNVAYNAFKLSLSGTDYYYVLDNTQTAWVIDLSFIGYSLSPFTT